VTAENINRIEEENPAENPDLEANADDTILDPASQVDEELEGMEQAVASAEEELIQHRDAMLRMQAEMENLRKRLIRDQERSRKFALEGVMKDLLQVRDSLERALEVDPVNASVESLREGEELTLKLLSKVMADHGLELIDPVGEVFNPEFHEAVAMLPSEDAAENTVLNVMQKGFRLHDRLIRPAMVVVARKP
jgi:molecular chaperone GrpE